MTPVEDVPVTVSLGDARDTRVYVTRAGRFDSGAVVAPPAGEIAEAACADAQVPLIRLAWARSGDKGDAFNVGVIARRSEFMPWIRAALSEAAVLEYFAHEFEGGANPAVVRYELPGLNALNLHCKDALGGGQFASLRLDPLAKGKAQQLLDMPVKVPRSLIDG